MIRHTTGGVCCKFIFSVLTRHYWGGGWVTPTKEEGTFYLPCSLSPPARSLLQQCVAGYSTGSGCVVVMMNATIQRLYWIQSTHMSSKQLTCIFHNSVLPCFSTFVLSSTGVSMGVWKLQRQHNYCHGLLQLPIAISCHTSRAKAWWIICNYFTVCGQGIRRVKDVKWASIDKH
jgi:hypothetical protein